jgi:sec-independent protein translocase protein TatA
MFNIGPQELLIILIVALVVVGPKRLPEFGRTIGRGLNEFRKLQDEVRDMVKFDLGGDAFLHPPEVYEPETDIDTDTEPDLEPHGLAEDAMGNGVEPMTHSERVLSFEDEDAPGPEEADTVDDAPVADTPPPAAAG